MEDMGQHSHVINNGTSLYCKYHYNTLMDWRYIRPIVSDATFNHTDSVGFHIHSLQYLADPLCPLMPTVLSSSWTNTCSRSTHTTVKEHFATNFLVNFSSFFLAHFNRYLHSVFVLLCSLHGSFFFFFFHVLSSLTCCAYVYTLIHFSIIKVAPKNITHTNITMNTFTWQRRRRAREREQKTSLSSVNFFAALLAPRLVPSLLSK